MEAELDLLDRIIVHKLFNNLLLLYLLFLIVRLLLLLLLLYALVGIIFIVAIPKAALFGYRWLLMVNDSWLGTLDISYNRLLSSTLSDYDYLPIAKSKLKVVSFMIFP
jgi:hypothetical protein